MTLPTPITDAALMNVGLTGAKWSTLAILARELERDAMTMAIYMLSDPFDAKSHTPDLREVMERWRPRVRTLLEAK